MLAQKYPLPGIGADGAEQAILEEFDDAKEVVHSLSDEYQACESENYIERMTTGHGMPALPSEDRDRRIPAS